MRTIKEQLQESLEIFMRGFPEKHKEYYKMIKKYIEKKDRGVTMTQTEKALLLKDICARLPYGVICFAPDYEYGDIGKLWCIEPFEDLDPSITVQYPKGNTITKFCSEVKPYLRPMSSMTSDEFEEFINIVEHISIGKSQINIANPEAFDFLNAHHFDYRGLIDKGLALEVSEGMYG